MHDFVLSNVGNDLICNCDSKGKGAIDVGVLTSKDQLPVTKLSYGDDYYRDEWKKYELGNLVCSGKNGFYPSEDNEKKLYWELRNDLNDVQEKNFAFKYRVGTSSNAVKSGKIVKFDTQIYGNSVEDGVFTAQVGKYLDFLIQLYSGD